MRHELHQCHRRDPTSVLPQENDPDALQRLTDLASAVEPGCGGVEFVPFIHGGKGPRSPPRHRHHHRLFARAACNPGVIFRAALETITANLCSGVARMKRLGVEVKTPCDWSAARSKNPLWRQMIADTLQVPITLPQEPESAALGACIVGPVGSVGRGKFREISCHEKTNRWVPVSSETITPETTSAES